MSDFSFASLIKPGEGATMALKRHLHACQARDAARKKPNWIYGGACDLLLQHGTFFTGRELDATWEHLRGPKTRCHDNSLEAAEADRTLRYFTGLYVVAGDPCPHSWCVDADGELVEVTLPNATMRGERPMTARKRGGSQRPMLTPAHWAYVGVEYDVDFIRAHSNERGLPILDPFYDQNPTGELGCYLHSEDPPMWSTPYSPSGFTIIPAPDLCHECMGWGCGDCGETGVRP